MKSSIFFIWVIVLAGGLNLCSAQVQDDFSDGNFTSNPVWTGDADSFIVISGQLRSNGVGAGKGGISVGSTSLADAEWRLWLKFNLSPSTSNFCRVYLVSDQADLKGNLNGYYVQLGGSTGNTDTISLYRQNGSVRTRIIAGRPGTVSKSVNFVQLKVTRDNSGLWTLWSDTTGGVNFVSEGSATDLSVSSSQYAGVYCQYTSSNTQNFFFDDFYAGPPIVDITPPSFDSLTVVSSSQLLVAFSEAVDLSTSQEVLNYVGSSGIGNPATAVRQADQKSVMLTFSGSFPLGQQRTLTVSAVKDLIGNALTSAGKNFTYYSVQAKDIVIDELFPDPSPQVALPNAEFVELYNRSLFPLNIKNCILTDGSSNAVMPDFVLKPDSFVIICPTANVTDFQPYGKVLGVSSFPSLNNTGDVIRLYSSLGLLIDEVSYDLSWYHDAVKQNGGWTMELVNPGHPCSGANNWKASADVSGGTPGKVNSVFSGVADTQAPQPMSVVFANDNQLQMVFDELTDSVSLAGATIAIDNGISVVQKVVSGSNHDSLLVTVSPAFVAKTSYTIQVSGPKDCWGNTLSGFSKTLMYQPAIDAVSYGVLITEILADEAPSIGLPDAEYIELYNHMDGPVNLSGWIFTDGSSHALLPSYVLMPDSFVIVCSSANVLQFSSYPNVIGVSSFPSLNNDGEMITLLDVQGRVIHGVTYSSDWYKDNFKKDGGWSLEMIDVENPCSGAPNWTVSQSPSGGTPGAINSVKGTQSDQTRPELLRAYMDDVFHVVLVFSEAVDSVRAKQVSYYQIEGMTVLPSQVSFLSYDFTRVRLTFADSLHVNQLYTISADSLTDCAGNFMKTGKQPVRFGIALYPDSADLLVNEVLFNPHSGGYDFIEIYNKSNKIIDLSRLYMANTDDADQIKDFYRISAEPLLCLPLSYVALTESPTNVLNNYHTPNRRGIYLVSSLPSLPDDEGSIVIMDSTGKRFDQFNYKSAYHHPMIDTKDGVSLERIDYLLPTQDANNWTSASSTSGYATPAYQNSQFRNVNVAGSGFELVKEVFSPDGDGFEDQLLLTYNLNKPGYVCNLDIYDSRGTFVKHLLRNEVLGASGSLKWEGDNEQGSKVQVGIYILQVSLHHPSGDSKEFRKSCVAATKF